MADDDDLVIDEKVEFAGAWAGEGRSLDLVLSEALELLALWYGRWTGVVAGTPNEMVVRTRALLVSSGRKPAEPPTQG